MMTTTTPSNVFHIDPDTRSCKECRIRQLCLTAELNPTELAQLDCLARQRRPLTRGAHLFHIGDPLEAVYAIRSGSVKTYTLTPDGREQVTGLRLPGDLVGLDAIGRGIHPSAAEALETTSICALPLNRLEGLKGSAPKIQQRLMQVMSEEIQDNEEHITLLGKQSAEQRIANLLLNLAKRYQLRGYSVHEFNLSMSRTDIGNYLGLAIETVSRLFTRLQELGLISVERKHVRINDLEKLRSFASPVDTPATARAHA